MKKYIKEGGKIYKVEKDNVDKDKRIEQINKNISQIEKKKQHEILEIENHYDKTISDFQEELDELKALTVEITK